MNITVTIFIGTQPDIQCVVIVDFTFDSRIAVGNINTPELVCNLLFVPYNYIAVLRNLSIAIDA